MSGTDGIFLFMDSDVFENDWEIIYELGKLENELRILKSSFEFKIENERLEFLVKLNTLIEAWEGDFPDLQTIFGDGEIELLILDYIPKRTERRLSREENNAAIRFIRFVVSAGYKNKPKLDNDRIISVSGRTPIHQAYDFRYYAVIDDLFKIYNRFDVTYIDDRGLTHYHIACSLGSIDIVLKFLETPGRDINCRSYYLTPLCLALKQGHTHVIEELLKKGANPNLAHPKKFTPLHFICMENTYENLAEVFVELCNDISGVEPVLFSEVDESGRTPLHWALQHSDPSTSTVTFLLKNVSDPNVADKDGSSYLHIISRKQEYEDDTLAQLFFEIMGDRVQTVQIDAKDKLGRTPLQWAVANSLPCVVIELLNHGADLSTFHFPEESHLEEMVRRCYDEIFHIPMHKLIFACRSLQILDTLKLKGYKLKQSDAMKMMKVFAKLKMIEKSADNIDPNWYDRDNAFATEAKKIMFTEQLSLYTLIQSQFEQDVKLLTHEEYTKFVRSSGWHRLMLEGLWKICAVRLCERLLGRFFQRWSLEPFMELTHYRLPILCSEMVVKNLSNEDLFNICFGGSDKSPELLTDEPVRQQ